MKLLAPVLAVLLFIGCGDDDSPTASNPGDELVGTWVGVSSTEFESEAGEEAFRKATVVVRRDGTMSLSLEVAGLSIAIEEEWEIVGGKLIVISTVAGETETTSDSYTIRGNRLTLVDDESGTVEIWEKCDKMTVSDCKI